MRVAVIGAGWAGMAAAVETTRAGHTASVFEASRTLGGRARVVQGTLPDGTPVALDNGQHILIGAYSETLRLMTLVGVNPATALLRLPLTLRFPDGSGIEFPRWVSPLDALGGIWSAKGWSVPDKISLSTTAARWQWMGFTCPGDTTVSQLCAALRPRVMAELIEPLCVSALNTPAQRASGQVFLRVMRDSLLGGPGSSNLLLPRLDLSALFPQAAASWLAGRGAQLVLAKRIDNLKPSAGGGWLVNGEVFDAVILATSASSAAALVGESVEFTCTKSAQSMQQWADLAKALQFEAITTVYAFSPSARLDRAMLALRSQTLPAAATTASAAASWHPAQFVFDRGQLDGPAGLLAFVVSASTGEREALETAVVAQAREQLGLSVQPIQTIVEKRATFACTPGLQRPGPSIAPGLLACGDYCEGPYPATLEGAVRSAMAAVKAMDALGTMQTYSRPP